MAIIGAILGDISGSQYEFLRPKDLDWKKCELFTDKCYFTDDSVMTLAAKLAVKNGISFADSYRRFGRKYPNAGYGEMFDAWLHWDDEEAYDTVTYPEIDGDYMYVEKIKERYTMHTRTVTYTTGSGKTRTTHTRVETYWTWDRIGSEDKTCEELIFCGVTFPSSKIDIPSPEYIKTIKESSHVRYKYYGTPIKHNGTIFTKLENNTIQDNTRFYENKNIKETVTYLESDCDIFLFWLFWILLIGICVFAFYYIDNKWLE